MAVSEQHQALFDIFKSAIEDERKSQALYERAAALCDDEVMRDTFLQLRAEEGEHEGRLQELYKNLRPQVTPD